MPELVQYFEENVLSSPNSYFREKFGNTLKEEIEEENSEKPSLIELFFSPSNVEIFKVADDTDAIQIFRSLLEPNLDPYGENNQKFIYLCFYLDSLGFYIEQFPSILSRPQDLNSFSFGDIRKAIMKQTGENSVAYEDRRKLAAELVFKKRQNTSPNESAKAVLNSISTNSVEFQKKEIDEQLADICNAIEFVLKKPNGKFKAVTAIIPELDIVNDSRIKILRNKLHAFRHGAKESVDERKSYSVQEKRFLREYGCFVLNYLLTNNEER